jgi:hypothetical protein
MAIWLGVAAPETPESPLSPASFTALTTKKYVIPFVRPVITLDVITMPVSMVVKGPPADVDAFTV